jgi:protein PhnA
MHKQCELCTSETELSLLKVAGDKPRVENAAVLVCSKCRTQIENPGLLDTKHWFCLRESIWSEHTPVKVLAYRLLHQLKQEVWAQELLEQIYLDEDDLLWAQAGLTVETEEDSIPPTVDSYGTALAEGDSVTLIKDLEVKGGGFTAKRGTLVKNISLTNDPKYIEGKVNGVQIVLVAGFLKKANS